MITFLLRVRQTGRYNCWQWVLARVLANNIDPRSISTRIVTINKIDSYLFKGQFSQPSVQYSRFAIWLVLQTASKPHSYICIDRVILRTRNQRSNMTNLQHLALFMFLIFLPMGRGANQYFVTCFCFILSALHFNHPPAVSLMSTVAKLVKEPEFDEYKFSLRVIVKVLLRIKISWQHC